MWQPILASSTCRGTPLEVLADERGLSNPHFRKGVLDPLRRRPYRPLATWKHVKVHVWDGLPSRNAVPLDDKDPVGVHGSVDGSSGTPNHRCQVHCFLLGQVQDRFDVTSRDYEGVARHASQRRRRNDDVREIVLMHDGWPTVPWVTAGEVLAEGTWRLARDLKRHRINVHIGGKPWSRTETSSPVVVSRLTQGPVLAVAPCCFRRCCHSPWPNFRQCRESR